MTEEEIDNMLLLFHELGVVLHFRSTEALHALVTTRPQWLIDSISKVIRDKAIHPYDPLPLEQAGLTSDAHMLLSMGLATRDLLSYLWDGAHVDFLIDLMRSLLLLSDWRYFDAESVFIVPCMLPRVAKVGGYHTDVLTGASTSRGIKMSLAFSYLLPGIYERLICILVSTQQGGNEPVLSRTGSLLHFNAGYSVAVVPSAHQLEFTVDKPMFAAEFATLVLSVMERIKSEVMGDRLTYETMVEVRQKMVLYDERVKRGSSPWATRRKKGSRRRLGRQLRFSFQENII